MGERIFEKLVSWSIEGSIVVLVILTLRFFMKNKLKKSLTYYLWLALIIKILIPVSLESSISVFNIVKVNNFEKKVVQEVNNNISENILVNEKSTNEDNINSNKTLQSYNQDEGTNNLNEISNYKEDINTNNLIDIINLKDLLGIVWIIGVLGLGFKTIYEYYKFRKKIKDEIEYDDLNFSLDDLKEKLNIKKKVYIKESNLIKSPLLIGEFSPIILVPSNLKSVLTKKEYEFIILHELAHLKRKDIVILWLFKLVTIINFYNPLILYSYKLMKEDCEKACDEYVLSKIDRNDNISYGTTILKVIENIAFDKKEILGTTMAINKDEVKNRIINIKDNKVFSKRNILVGSILVGLIFIITLTTGEQKEFSFKNLFDNVYKIEITTLPSPPQSKIIYRENHVNNILNLLENLSLKEIKNENKKGWDFKLDIYGDENNIITIIEDEISLNSKVYKTDIDSISKLKSLYNELEYPENNYMNNSTDLVSQESNKILYDMGYESFVYNGERETILIPEDTNKIIEGRKLKLILDSVYESGKENQAITGYTLMNFQEKPIDITLYSAISIEKKNDYKTLVVFSSEDNIITYYLTDLLSGSESNYTDEMTLIRNFKIDDMNLVDSKNYTGNLSDNIKSLIEAEGYNIYLNNKEVINIRLPRTFDHMINETNIGEALGRLYEKSIESESITNNSLINHLGGKVEMGIYSIYENENIDNYKDFIYFAHDNQLISYYFDDLSEISDKPVDERMVISNLAIYDDTHDYGYYLMMKYMRAQSFKVEEIKEETIESDYIKNEVKRYETKLEDENAVIYEFSNKEDLENALNVLNKKASYDETKNKLEEEDINVANEIFSGNKIIVLFEGENEEIIRFLKDYIVYQKKTN